MSYKVQSPVLFLNFNRPDLSLIVFNKIKQARPARLYFAVDGPRQTHLEDERKCNEVKSLLNDVDWDCQIQTLFREENLGCKRAVSSAISWFFEHEEEGIILEDDCLPAESFFYFCDQLLDKYRDNTAVNLITGTNLQQGQVRGDASYYFSQYSNIWGWASWKRVWDNYDASLKNYDEATIKPKLESIFNESFLVEEWLAVFKKLKAGEIDTWDYQLNFLTFFESALCATPNVNLISNIGFRDDATHINTNLHNANLPVQEITTITHPASLTPCKEADYYFLNKEFNLAEKWRQFEKDKLLRRRIKRWIKGLFTKKTGG